MLLLIDDNLTICEVVKKLFSGVYDLRITHTAAEGWAALEANAASVKAILLDWELPDQNGIDFLRKLKQDSRFRLTPVLMLTGRTDEKDIEAGIAAGALYYVTKPFDHRILSALVETALRDFSSAHKTSTVRLSDYESLLTELSFRFSTVSQAGALSQLLAEYCPSPDAARLGLHELLVNAIEHGNLEISHAEKSKLLGEGTLPDEMARRQNVAPYANRSASVRMIRTSEEVRFIIRDQGPGFNYKAFLNLSADRAFAQHGRGIALARSLSFDHLSYVPPGNEVHGRITVPRSAS
ncbi:MAG TPA: response regulator [Leptospiraceae bacterium]|nr:response regulator [Leptospirales bacterium]HMU83914.1 response regulator [Leptospiraceae bacterium]HMW58336.1 response regulator [Leptospiraceae bacterium]HMX57514.1 response regulator [Leptospiraceae bacterium]HMY45498.1 response regulator [Leptospiraceae bacterium]